MVLSSVGLSGMWVLKTAAKKECKKGQQKAVLLALKSVDGMASLKVDLMGENLASRWRLGHKWDDKTGPMWDTASERVSDTQWVAMKELWKAHEMELVLELVMDIHFQQRY